MGARSKGTPKAFAFETGRRTNGGARGHPSNGGLSLPGLFYLSAYYPTMRDALVFPGAYADHRQPGHGRQSC